MMRRVFLDRRIRFLVICTLTLAAGAVIEIYLIAHYVAPFTVVFYAIGLQGMRHLRVWTTGGQPVGATIVRLTVLFVIALAGLRIFTGPLHMDVPSGRPRNGLTNGTALSISARSALRSKPAWNSSPAIN